MAQLQVDMQGASEENEGLHRQMEEMFEQLEELRLEHVKYQEFWEERSEQGRVIAAIRDRIEELRDGLSEQEQVDSE
jgi:hypothetical protein